MVYAVALALHKNRDRNASPGSMMATVTTVKSNDSGQIERDDHAARTWEMEFHQDEYGDYNRQLRTAIYKFLGTVTQVAKLHQESGTTYALPVIVGLDENSINPEDLKSGIRDIFQDELRNLKSQSVGLSLIVELFRHLLGNTPNKIEFIKGLYIDSELGQTFSEEELEEAKKQNSYLQQLKREAESSDKVTQVAALEELRQYTRICAEAQKNILSRNTRFLNLRYPEQTVGENLISGIFRYFGLRELFIEEVKKIMSIKNNFTVKVNGDLPGRPFEDIARTIVQDMLDGLPLVIGSLKNKNGAP